MQAEASPDLVIAPRGGRTQTETRPMQTVHSAQTGNGMHWYGVHQPLRWVLEKGGKQEIMIKYMDSFIVFAKTA